jgi:predicted Rossmann fold nucleotide-binding protein DprA/Smf involved in DNA uptake
MIDFETLSPDAPAIIMLCTSLGEPRGGAGDRPLGPVAFARLAEALTRSSLQSPRDLPGMSADEIAGSLDVDPDLAASYARRVARGGQLTFELDRLRSRGIWVLTIADEAYPAALRDRLGTSAPPVLFGTGPAGLLGGGGVAIVGSRDADQAAVAFTERLASAAARGGAQIVSGGARGVDAVSMRAAFESGGVVVGVVPEGVERRLREATTRTAVADYRAVLVSPSHASAGFSAGAAMGRNKLIYALSDVAVIVSSAEGSGGTWTGAIEALKGGWVPVLVRDEVGAPTGNAALIARGASPLSDTMIGETTTAEALRTLAAAAGSPSARVAEAVAPDAQARLFDD